MLRLFGFVYLALTIGCGKGGSSHAVIPETAFADLMVDVHLAEASVFNLRANTDTSRQTLALQYGRVLASHNTTWQEFDTSFEYYLNHPEALFRIYEKVLEELTALEVKWSSGHYLGQ